MKLKIKYKKHLTKFQKRASALSQQTSESLHKNRVCHSWTGNNGKQDMSGFCARTNWHRNQILTVASALNVFCF